MVREYCGLQQLRWSKSLPQSRGQYFDSGRTLGAKLQRVYVSGFADAIEVESHRIERQPWYLDSNIDFTLRLLSLGIKTRNTWTISLS